MTFTEAIQMFMAEQSGTPRTLRRHLRVLQLHMVDCGPRGLAGTHEDVERTLSRWQSAQTQHDNRVPLRRFYDWLAERGLRDDNPQTNPARREQSLRTVPALSQITGQDLEALAEMVARSLGKGGPRIDKFSHAVDLFFRDMAAEGRLAASTESSYRKTLDLHADDIDERHPALVTRGEVKTTLHRWTNPSTIKGRLAALVSFYDWCMQEGVREDNPARQVRRPKIKERTSVYRLTRSETAAILGAAQDALERRIVTLGACEGLRNAELRGLTGRHFARPGFVWVSEDIAKGGVERWVPVLPDARAVVADIRATFADGEFVLPRLVPIGGMAQATTGRQVFKEDRSRSCSSQTVNRTVARVAERAGIKARIHAHLLRHAFGDHVAKASTVGIQHAQQMLGHADVSTTISTYVNGYSLDELAAAVQGLTYFDSPPDPSGRSLRRVS